jgi:hypothetical protein
MAVGWTVTLQRIARVTELLIELGVKGATITPGIGLWEGAQKPSLVIELLGDYTAETARQLAETVREAHNQDSVLWTLETLALTGSEDRRARP